MARKWVEIYHPKTKRTAKVAESAVKELSRSGWHQKDARQDSGVEKKGA